MSPADEGEQDNMKEQVTFEALLMEVGMDKWKQHREVAFARENDALGPSEAVGLLIEHNHI